MSALGSSADSAPETSRGERPALHQRYGAVDSLRFFAMVGVIAQHCDILPIGWVGVWVFFVISGFVVTQSVSAHASPNRGQALLGFYARRAARILPLYYIFALVAAAVLLLSRSGAGAEHLVPVLLLVQNIASVFVDDWFPRFPISHLWTISSEMQFYALFGALFFVVSRRTLTLVMLALLVLTPLTRILVAAAYYAAPWDERSYRILIEHTLLSQADAFAAGVLLSLLVHRVTLRAAGLLLGAGVLATVAFFGVYMGVNALWFGRRGLDIVRDIASGDNIGQYREIALYTPIILVSVALVAAALTNSTLARWLRLDHPFLQRAGRTSYSGYIWHFAVIAGLQALWATRATGFVSSGPSAWNVATFLCAVPLTVLAAELSFRWIEKPLNWMARKLPREAGRDRRSAFKATAVTPAFKGD